MKAQKFFVGLIAIILVIAIAGGIAIFTIPELQTKIADTIVEKSQIYKDTCTELSVEKARANILSLQLSTEISAKNELQQRYDDMEAERDDLLAQINEEYVIYFVEYSTNTDNAFKFYLKNFTNESPVITLGMYDVNDVLTETFEFTLVNFANPENAPNTVVEDDLTSLADTYHIKFLDGNMVLSDFICEDGSALDKPFNVYYEVFRKDTMFDVMQSRIARSDTSIIDLQNQLASANARIAELEQLSQQLSNELDEISRNNNVSVELYSSNYFLQVLDENGSFITYLSKNIYFGNTNYNSLEVSGFTLSKFDTMTVGNIHTDDSYRVRIEGFNEGNISGHQHYYQSTDDNVPTYINLSVVDSYGNPFDVSTVDNMSRYRIVITELDHTCYTKNELVGTTLEGRDDVMKTLNVSLTIEYDGSMGNGGTYTQYFDMNLGDSEYWVFRSVYDDSQIVAFAKDGSHIYSSIHNSDCYILSDDGNGFQLLCFLNGNIEIYEHVSVYSSTEIYFAGMRFILS